MITERSELNKQQSFKDPAPVLEASHSLEEHLVELQSSSPDSETLVKEISGHWRRHLECLNAESKEEGTVTVERVEASEQPPHMMTPNSTPSLQDGGSPPHNHQGLHEREADEADTTLSGRLAHAEDRIKALQSSLNKAQSELQELRCKYDQEMAAKRIFSILVLELPIVHIVFYPETLQGKQQGEHIHNFFYYFSLGFLIRVFKNYTIYEPNYWPNSSLAFWLLF
ncbi:hypothetical protein SRHO_G00321400 [Serrasalmus rhombeus]